MFAFSTEPLFIFSYDPYHILAYVLFVTIPGTIFWNRCHGQEAYWIPYKHALLYTFLWSLQHASHLILVLLQIFLIFMGSTNFSQAWMRWTELLLFVLPQLVYIKLIASLLTVVSRSVVGRNKSDTVVHGGDQSIVPEEGTVPTEDDALLGTHTVVNSSRLLPTFRRYQPRVNNAVHFFLTRCINYAIMLTFPLIVFVLVWKFEDFFLIAILYTYLTWYFGLVWMILFDIALYLAISQRPSSKDFASNKTAKQKYWFTYSKLLLSMVCQLLVMIVADRFAEWLYYHTDWLGKVDSTLVQSVPAFVSIMLLSGNLRSAFSAVAENP